MISFDSILSVVRRSLVVALCLFAGQALAQSTVLYLQSDAGDYIGQGEVKMYQPPQYDFSVTRTWDNGINVEVDSDEGGWTLRLSGRGDTGLAVGPYEMAARTPFRGTSPGLDFSGFRRGCNNLTGRFVVLAVSYDPTGAVTQLAVNFEQRCDDGPPLWGEIRINSTVPLSTQEPTQSTTPDSFAFLPRPHAVAFTVLTSNPVTIYGINAPAPISIVGGTYSIDGGPFISSPGFVSNRSRVRVRMVSSPSPGGTVSATLTVGGVAAPFDATTYQPGTVLSGLYYLSTAGDPVGQGEEVLHIAPDARFDVRRAGAGLQVLIEGPGGTHAGLVIFPPTGSPLAPGFYAAATRFDTPTSPGLDFSGNGNGCNQTSGEFEIFELERDAGGEVTKLSLDFVQRCEGTGPPLYGEIRFNSAIPFSPFDGAVPANPPRVAGISTRMQVLTGDNVMIGGFVIGGSQPKTVVIRARGPSLAAAGISNVLFNPVLQLFSGQTPLVGNDDWGTASNAEAIEASGFAPSHPAESAILVTLAPGAYTAIVSGADGTTGVGIVEVFEVGQPEVPLAGISTRGTVLTGDSVMIGGFVIHGDAPQTIIVRARGPSLASHGITSFLANPTLQLVRSSDQATIGSNDDWGTAPNAAEDLAAGFQPGDPSESAILITLEPRAYTAIVRGSGGTGVGIVEVFTQ